MDKLGVDVCVAQKVAVCMLLASLLAIASLKYSREIVGTCLDSRILAELLSATLYANQQYWTN